MHKLGKNLKNIYWFVCEYLSFYRILLKRCIDFFISSIKKNSIINRTKDEPIHKCENLSSAKAFSILFVKNEILTEMLLSRELSLVFSRYFWIIL